MRIAIVTNRAAYYRLPIFREVARELQVDCYFTATDIGRWWDANHPDDSAGINGHRVPQPHSLYRALVDNEYDCIVYGLGGRGHLLAVAAASARVRRPTICWVDMWQYPRSLLHSPVRPVVRRFLRTSNAILSGGPHISAWIKAETGRQRGIFEMTNAVENEWFSQPIAAQESAARRDSFGLCDVDVVGLFVGRLSREKGIATLLEALAEAPPQVGLVVAGTGPDEARLRMAVDRLALNRRVRLIGWVAQGDLPVLYEACDFLVMPSITTRLFKEPWGMVANEAMNRSLPVVSSDSVGAAAGGLVVDGETGLVVPERDASALSEAMTRLSIQDDFRTDLGRRARERVQLWNFGRAAEAWHEAISFACATGSSLRTPQHASSL